MAGAGNDGAVHRVQAAGTFCAPPYKIAHDPSHCVGNTVVRRALRQCRARNNIPQTRQASITPSRVASARLCSSAESRFAGDVDGRWLQLHSKPSPSNPARQLHVATRSTLPPAPMTSS